MHFQNAIAEYRTSNQAESAVAKKYGIPPGTFGRRLKHPEWGFGHVLG